MLNTKQQNNNKIARFKFLSQLSSNLIQWKQHAMITTRLTSNAKHPKIGISFVLSDFRWNCADTGYLQAPISIAMKLWNLNSQFAARISRIVTNLLHCILNWPRRCRCTQWVVVHVSYIVVTADTQMPADFVERIVAAVEVRRENNFVIGIIQNYLCKREWMKWLYWVNNWISNFAHFNSDGYQVRDRTYIS